MEENHTEESSYFKLDTEMIDSAKTIASPVKSKGIDYEALSEQLKKPKKFLMKKMVIAETSMVPTLDEKNSVKAAMEQREKSKILEKETGKKHGILNSFLLRNDLS